jgi:hypothetical protein
MPTSPPLAEAVKEAVKDKEVQIALGAVAAGASAWALYRYYKYGVAPWESVYTDAGVFPKKKVCICFTSAWSDFSCEYCSFPWSQVQCGHVVHQFFYISRSAWLICIACSARTSLFRQGGWRKSRSRGHGEANRAGGSLFLDER